MKVDPRFLRGDGREVFNGNELLVKGCLEAPGGVSLFTGYPGSPVATFFDTLGYIRNLLTGKGMRAFQANNESLAAAALNGSQMAPMRGVVAMKSVGLHVAADALALGNLAGPHAQGGAVVICGDDPWCDSTQVPADSRFLFEHLRMPVVEPGTNQEFKDWLSACFELSREAALYIGYVVTTTLADGGGTVACSPNHYPDINTNAQFDLDSAAVDFNKVLLPPRTWQRELEIPGRLAKAVETARRLGINKIIPASTFQRGVQGGAGVPPANNTFLQAGETPAPRTLVPRKDVPAYGFITTGMAKSYLEQILLEAGLEGQFPILNMGMPYPADVQLVRELAGQCGTMIVIEERRSFLEKNLRDALFNQLQPQEAGDLVGRLYGKKFPSTRVTNYESRTTTPGIPETRGLNPSLLATLILPLIQATETVPAELRNGTGRGNISKVLDQIKRASKRTLDVLGAAPTSRGSATSVAASQSGCGASSDAAAEAADRSAPIEDDALPKRLPTFCPGCPHRDSSAALLELRRNLADEKYMRRWHKRGPVDLVAHGDTGCYTMLMFPPTEPLMHNYSGMGLGSGTGSGIDAFIKNKQIVFMGDGTFFHSGAVGISNAVKAGQDITFIILENGTTAMTGHQEHPGTEKDVLGNTTPLQNIEPIVRAMEPNAEHPLHVVRMSPAEREKYYDVLEKTILKDGVKVIIADKECGITYHRREGKKEREVIKKIGFLPEKTHMNITQEVCEHCLQCTKQTVCPGLSIVDTDYGKKVDTDLTWCVNDGACERVKASNEYGTHVKPCPSFEQVTIVRKKRKRYLLPKMDLAKLPLPTFVTDMTLDGAVYRAHLSGVGGMGIGVVSAILVRAGHSEGFDVAFCDKKGLAIRNGGVYAQVTYARRGASSEQRVGAGLIPYGQGDVLIGIDLLEAARACDPRDNFRIASPEKTAAVLNTHKQLTTPMLLGTEDFDTNVIRDRVAKYCAPDNFFARNLSEVCEQRLGSKQFVNIMMLGVAWQMGLIPVSFNSIAWAIKDTVKRGHRQNIKAFNIGRKLALEPRTLPNRPEPRTWQQLLTQKSKILRKTVARGPYLAKKLEQLLHIATTQMPQLSDQSKYDLALRLYDLMQYETPAYAKRYSDLVRTVYRRDCDDRKFAATHATIWNLAKAMLIKDEPYVAYLLTRYEKKVRDAQKFGVDEANGDRIIYKHHTSPEFPVGPYRLRLKITTTDWMLNIVRRAKFLRKIPGWHKREVEFREWYVGLLGRVDLSTNSGYDTALNVLNCLSEVKGYREVRYPTMDAAKAAVEDLLTTKPAAEVTLHTAEIAENARV